MSYLYFVIFSLDWQWKTNEVHMADKLPPNCPTLRKTDASALDKTLLAPEDVSAIQNVLMFLSREHGLLLGHIGRKLSLGGNTDIQAHLRRQKLTEKVAQEIVALCGQNDFRAFLDLPRASEINIAHAVEHLRAVDLIGRVIQKSAFSGAHRRWVRPRS